MFANLTPKRARWFSWACGAAAGLCTGIALGMTSPLVAGVLAIASFTAFAGAVGWLLTFSRLIKENRRCR